MQRLVSLFLAVVIPATYAFAENAEKPEADIRDIRPPVSFILDPLKWLIIIFLIVSIAIFFLLVYRHISIKRRTGSRRPVELPWEIALDRLMTLRYQDHSRLGNYEQYYTQLSEIFRDYIAARFEVNAPEMTTEEFLGFLKEFSKIPEKYKDDVADFLVRSDMAKFARAGIYEEKMQQDFGVVKGIVNDTVIVEEPEDEGQDSQEAEGQGSKDGIGGSDELAQQEEDTLDDAQDFEELGDFQDSEDLQDPDEPRPSLRKPLDLVDSDEDKEQGI